jgi:NADPH:quinone reductase-like Zn-dependent oxidoreductase
MKAAIIAAPGQAPTYGTFTDPTPTADAQLITVTASALTNLTKSRASGSHYSSDNIFPSIPGVDGVGLTSDGRRVYFALPEAPYGALAEKSLVEPNRCVPLPDSLDDITAAAIANPGMSAWAGLVERARLQRGETVLINGATSTAGRLAIQLAKHLGARKVIGTGRSVSQLDELLALGVDKIIPFQLGPEHSGGAKHYEQALAAEFAQGIDVVLDYLWGESAKTIIVAIAKSVEDAHPVRFVHVGEAGHEPTIELPGAALRSSAIQLMGSGVKSVSFAKLLEAIHNTFNAVAPAKLHIDTKVVPLSEIETAWQLPGKPRVVVTMK